MFCRQDNRVQQSKLRRKDNDETYTIDLTITNATLADKGLYTCHAKDSIHKSESSIYVNVYGE